MAIKMLITDAGLAEVVNAEQSGTAPVVLSHIAFGTGQYTPTADMTALKSEFKRFDSIKGGAIADNVIHISVHDTDKQAYTVYEVGVFTESGTLFAVGSQTTPIVQKAEDAEVMLVTDFVLSDIDVDSITIGDTNFILNPATTETAGIVELATEAEAKAGTDETKAITPATLDATIEAHDNIVHRTGAENIAGIKTFTSGIVLSHTAPGFIIRQTDVNKGEVPSTIQYGEVMMRDAGNSTMGSVGNYYDTSGNMRMELRAYKGEASSNSFTALGITYPANGDPYATAPTPASGDNSTKIATTAFVNNKANNYLPLAGGKMTNQNAIMRSVDNSYLSIVGGSSVGSGAQLDLCGKNHEAIPSAFQLHARNGDTDKVLVGETDGDLTWDGKHIVRSVNGVLANNAGNVAITAATVDALPVSGGTMNGEVATNTADFIRRTADNSHLGIMGGSSSSAGARMVLSGKDRSGQEGRFALVAHDGTNNSTLIGQPDGTLTWKDKSIVRSVNGTNADASGNVDVISTTITYWE